jgi:hypothetical protein
MFVGNMGHVFLLFVAAMVVPPFLLCTITAAFGARPMLSLEDRLAAWTAGVFYGVVIGAAAQCVLLGAIFSLVEGTLVDGVYVIFIAPSVGAVAAYYIARWMSAPT